MEKSISPIPYKFLFLFSILILIISPVSAGTNVFFTPYFNYDGLITSGGIDYSHYNITTQMQDSVAPNTTPWEVWVGSGLLGIGLLLLALLLTMRSNVGIPELERGIVMCVMATFPLGYCAFASFAIDRITGYGVTSQVFNTTTQAQASYYNHEYVYMENHLIYSEPLIGLIMIALVFVAIGIAYYFFSTHRLLRGESGRETDD